MPTIAAMVDKAFELLQHVLHDHVSFAFQAFQNLESIVQARVSR
jgi:hypothetical protein